jgi:uncharacterized protein
MKYTPSDKPNTRIDVADILRGIAIAGIILIHFLEHLNFFLFPEPKNEFWATINSAVWDSTFFLLAGKMYAIFAMLFGLSFFIQHDNQAQKGIDFRPRFLWRMFLLMLFGLFDLLFYNGDILFIYAVCGVLIIPLIRASNKVIIAFIILMLMQPVELVYLILGIIDPATQPMDLGSSGCYGAIIASQSEGTIFDVAVAGIKYGLPANFLWAIENGRMTQTILFFLLGIMLGRWRLFYDEGNNVNIWKKIFIGSIAAFAILLPLYLFVPKAVEIPCVSKCLNVALNMWKNVSMMFFIVSGTTLLYYRTSAKSWLIRIAPYGKMSLTNYLGQSLIGAAIFYNWGLGLFRVCGHTASFALGIVCIIVQFIFCTWWMKHHKRGPFEQLWCYLTWFGKKK